MRLLILIILLPELYLLTRISLVNGFWSGGDWLAAVGFLTEGLTLGLILLLLLHLAKTWSRLCASLLIFLYITVLAVQLVAFHASGGFLPWIALENIDNIAMLLAPRTVLFLVAALLYGIGALVAAWKFTPLKPVKTRLLAGLIMPLMLLTYLVPFGVAPLREAAAFGFVPDTPPTVSLIRTLLRRPSAGFDQPPFDALVKTTKLFPPLDLDQQYPLMKDQVYEQRPMVRPADRPPNVLIIFLEGVSTRHVAAYDGTFPGLMPAITEFASDKSSLLVHDYYSHTAATFRGLIGQLCSIYPAPIRHSAWTGEYQGNFFCLGDLFSEAGYRTAFLDPHFVDSDYLHAMLKRLNFGEVLTADEIIPRYLDGAVSADDIIELNVPLVPNTKALNDSSLFAALGRAVSNWGDAPNPQLLALYAFGTHAWLDTPEGGTKYADGMNNGLNTVHEQDRAFGIFWRNFRASPAYENTVVILTSDHAKYHEPTYVNALVQYGVTDYPGFFSDKIPFIIHDPRGVPQASLAAEQATSIDFAPTVADYLQLPNISNPFMGTSLFERETDIGLANLNGRLYLTSEAGIHDVTNVRSDKIVELKRYIYDVQDLMRQNRVWP